MRPCTGSAGLPNLLVSKHDGWGSSKSMTSRYSTDPGPAIPMRTLCRDVLAPLIRLIPPVARMMSSESIGAAQKQHRPPIYLRLSRGRVTTTPPEELTPRSAEVKTFCGQIDQLCLNDQCVLCRKYRDRHTQTDKLQIVVPHEYRATVADQLHRDLNGGHLDQTRAEQQLRRRFYWPGWASEASQAKLRCPECSKYQQPQNRKQAPCSQC